MRQLVSAVLLSGLVAVSLTGCPKKYESGVDTSTPPPVPADTGAPAPAPAADTTAPAPEPDTAAPAAEEPDAGPAPAATRDTSEPPADTVTPEVPAEDASEVAVEDASGPTAPAEDAEAPSDDVAPASEGDASTAAAEATPRWVVVPPATDGGASALLLSSQGGGAPELTRWLEPLTREAMNEDDPAAAFVKRAKTAKTRPAGLAEGATVQLLTAAGAEARKVTGLTVDELGGAMRVSLPLDGAPLASWSLAAIGAPAPAAGARFVPLSGKPPGDAVRERVWRQLLAILPGPTRDALAKGPPVAVTLYPAALGTGRTALVTVCVPDPDAGPEACRIQALALADGAGVVKGWLRTLSDDAEVKAPTLDGVACEPTFGVSEPCGVLYDGDDIAILVGLFAIGDELYDLLHVAPGPVRAEHLFSMIVE